MKKTEQLFEFSWTIPIQGLRWEERPNGSFLTDMPLPGQEEGERVIWPMRTPELYRHFGSIPEYPTAVKAFADRFGFLGIPDPSFVLIEHDQLRGTGVARGEALSTWQGEIAAFRRAVGVWDEYREDDTMSLRHRFEIRYEKGGAFAYYLYEGDHRVSGEPVVFDERIPFRLDRVRTASARNIRGVAAMYIEDAIERRLSEHTSARMRHEPSGRLSLRIQPKNLLGALWLQFAQDVDGDWHYERCKQCGTWWKVSPELHRPTRKYCGDACKMKAYRRRIDEARRLRAKGKSSKEIAEHFGSTPETIERWTRREGPTNG